MMVGLKRLGAAIPVLAAGLLVLAALYLVGERTSEGVEMGYVVSAAVLALAILSLAVGIRIGRLLGRLKRGEPGARLSLKLLVLFIGLSVPPVAIVYFFSLKFLHSTVESWYDVRVEKALTDALDLARRELDQRVSDAARDISKLGARLESADEQGLIRLLRNSGAQELSLLSESREVLAAVDANGALALADVPDEAAFATLDQRGRFALLETSGSGSLVRAIVRLNSTQTGDESRYLQGIYDIPQELGARTKAIETEFFAYQRLSYLRASIRLSFTVILSLVLLLSVLLAALAALSLAKRLVRPIGNLARATGDIAAGEFAFAEMTDTSDELGFLVLSFNRMVSELKRADDRTRENQALIEAQRSYLSAVLERLSAGIVTFDAHGELKSANFAASTILRVDLKALIGRSLDSMEVENPKLTPLVQSFLSHLQNPDREWREEITLGAAQDRQILACRGARLNVAHDGDGESHVLVAIDDQTMLNRAQRQAAWGEVARRLAHEVKNPLTPIQLAAERLMLKLKPKLDSQDAELLSRSTQTIVNQVDSLKNMVNAFSDYARPQALNIEPLLLSRLVNDALDLHALSATQFAFQLHIEEPEPRVRVDRHRIGQVLTNLFKNSLDALKESPPPSPALAEITVDICERDQSGQAVLELSLSDNGPGISPEIFARLFEPYATNKARGTGLGLAIVQRIIEEHSGSIRAENLNPRGARFVIRLPLA